MRESPAISLVRPEKIISAPLPARVATNGGARTFVGARLRVSFTLSIKSVYQDVLLHCLRAAVDTPVIQFRTWWGRFASCRRRQCLVCNERSTTFEVASW